MNELLSLKIEPFLLVGYEWTQIIIKPNNNGKGYFHYIIFVMITAH